MRQESPLFAGARQGRIQPAQIERFLQNVHLLVAHTPVHLRLAERVAREKGREELAGWFSEKVLQEQGHDRWAENDLQELRASCRELPAAGPAIAGAMLRLVRFIESTIRKDPALYLGYIFLAEYFTVIPVPEWLGDLEKSCGIPARFLSVMGNHSELDRGHATEGMDVIDRFVEENAAPDLLAVVEESMSIYADFCEDIGTSMAESPS
jgi:hypothetical protein